MEPNFEKLAEVLFSLKKGDTIDDLWDTEVSMEELDGTLGYTGQLVYPDLNIPEEVVYFFNEFYQYLQKNHINE